MSIRLACQFAMAAAVLLLAACGDGGHPIDLETVQPGGLDSFLLYSEADLPLGDPRDLTKGLEPGECVVEWYRGPGEYRRGTTNLHLGAAEPGRQWQGFSYGYRTTAGKMIYRATCVIPASRAAKLVMMEQMHVASLMGDELPELPAKIGGSGGSTVSTTSSDELDCGMEGQEPCDHDEIIVEGEDPCEDPNTYYESSTDSCRCYNDSCGDGEDPDGSTDDGGSSSGGSSSDGGGDGSQLGTDDLNRGDLPPQDTTCTSPRADISNATSQGDSIYAYWCTPDISEVPDHAYAAVIQEAVDSVLARCPELEEHWRRAGPHIRLFEASEEEGEEGQSFWGGAVPGGNWILLAQQWIDLDPQLGLTHELVHLYGLLHPTADPQETTQFRDMEYRCSGGRNARTS